MQTQLRLIQIILKKEVDFFCIGGNDIDFFHVSDHLEQLGGVSFFLQKINYLDGWGVPPHPARGKFHENNKNFLETFPNLSL